MIPARLAVVLSERASPASVRAAHWSRSGQFEEWIGLRETLEAFVAKAAAGMARDAVVLYGLHPSAASAPADDRRILELGASYCSYAELLEPAELSWAVQRATTGVQAPWPAELTVHSVAHGIRAIRHLLDNRRRHLEGAGMELDAGSKLKEAPPFLTATQEENLSALGNLPAAWAPVPWGRAQDGLARLRAAWDGYRAALASGHTETARAANRVVLLHLGHLTQALEEVQCILHGAGGTPIQR